MYVSVKIFGSKPTSDESQSDKIIIHISICLIQPNLDGSYEIIRGLLIEVQPQYTLYVRRTSTATLINTSYVYFRSMGTATLINLSYVRSINTATLINTSYVRSISTATLINTSYAYLRSINTATLIHMSYVRNISTTTLINTSVLIYYNTMTLFDF